VVSMAAVGQRYSCDPRGVANGRGQESGWGGGKCRPAAVSRGPGPLSTAGWRDPFNVGPWRESTIIAASRSVPGGSCSERRARRYLSREGERQDALGHWRFFCSTAGGSTLATPAEVGKTKRMARRQSARCHPGPDREYRGSRRHHRGISVPALPGSRPAGQMRHHSTKEIRTSLVLMDGSLYQPARPCGSPAQKACVRFRPGPGQAASRRHRFTKPSTVRTGDRRRPGTGSCVLRDGRWWPRLVRVRKNCPMDLVGRTCWPSAEGPAIVSRPQF